MEKLKNIISIVKSWNVSIGKGGAIALVVGL